MTIDPITVTPTETISSYRITADWTLTGKDTHIEREDQDITHLVRAYNIHHEHGSRPTIELEVFDVDEDGNKYIDIETGNVAMHTERGFIIGTTA